ncbi:winged helix-turn-helix transcriptional regulator [uncultured Ligilactobacillus sp.]|uniref:winged helix-turn-helix transcriptional regulator n=1 Tax=uncultured Ligilactobacillus sp. TaxID=2837633 RepID=UPI002729C31B|nr:winged helix-turn-helix transcriptional regulator [uncultured Ligilactobacillus sp.]
MVYQKIWQELSVKDQDVLAAIAQSGRARIKDIRDALGFSSSLMSVYRERLKQKGIVDTSDYGYLSLTLPHLENFIQLYHELP